MKNNNKARKGKKPRHANPLPGEIRSKEKEENANALRQADKDMSSDADFSSHSKKDDLDEGETARLGKDKNDLI